jgi:hypothetical protein
MGILIPYPVELQILTAGPRIICAAKITIVAIEIERCRCAVPNSVSGSVVMDGFRKRGHYAGGAKRE